MHIEAVNLILVIEQFYPKLENYINSLDEKTAQDNKSCTAVERQRGFDEYEKIVQLFIENIREIRSKFVQIKEILVREKQENIDELLLPLKNKLNSYIYKFYQNMNIFKTARRNRDKRIIELKYGPVDEETLQKIIAYGKIEDIILHENINSIVSAIENRFSDVQKLENDVLELQSLFTDVSLLVDNQDQSIEIIQQRIDNAKKHVEIGEAELQDAEKISKKSRKMYCSCLLLLLLAVCAILFPVFVRFRIL